MMKTPLTGDAWGVEMKPHPHPPPGERLHSVFPRVKEHESRSIRGLMAKMTFEGNNLRYVIGDEVSCRIGTHTCALIVIAHPLPWSLVSSSVDRIEDVSPVVH